MPRGSPRSACPSTASCAPRRASCCSTPAGVAAMARAARSGAWPRPDLLSRLSLRLADGPRRGQTLARSLAVARAPRRRPAAPPAAAAAGDAPGSASGIAGWPRRTLAAARALGGPVAAMIHDTIPLDRPRGPARGRARGLRDAARRRRAPRRPDPRALRGRGGRRARATSPGSGLRRPRSGPSRSASPCPVPDPAALPPGLPPPRALRRRPRHHRAAQEPRPPARPLGGLARGAAAPDPGLARLGQRGGAAPGSTAASAGVTEVAGLPDGAVAALLDGAAALLDAVPRRGLRPAGGGGRGARLPGDLWRPRHRPRDARRPGDCLPDLRPRMTGGPRWRPCCATPRPGSRSRRRSWADHLKAVLSLIG